MTTTTETPAPALGSAAAPHPAAAPDWGATTEPVRCPLCDYDLRGLAEPRCPECGYRFTWPEVLDPERRIHPYLFEHHPHRAAWAFARTLFGTLSPERFWRGLLPSQPGRPRRVVWYWVLAALPLLAVFVGSNVHRGRVYAASNRQERAIMLGIIARQPQFGEHIAGQFGSVDAYFAAQMPSPDRPSFYSNYLRWQFLGNPRPADKVLAGVLAWPWLTVLALMVFRISMRRARIRRVHVMRCVLYSADVLLWVGLVAAPAVAWQGYALANAPAGAFNKVHWPAQFLLPAPDHPAEWALYLACAAGVGVLCYRLVMAYRHYLRFDRPFATVLASQVIVFLIVWVVVVNWGMA